MFRTIENFFFIEIMPKLRCFLSTNAIHIEFNK